MTGATHIGSLVRSLRLRRGWSQREQADRTALHRSNLIRLERGDHWPSLRVLARVARGLDVPVSTLVAPLDQLNPDEES